MERRGTNEALTHYAREAFASQRAGQLREDRQVGMHPDPIDPTDAER